MGFMRLWREAFLNSLAQNYLSKGLFPPWATWGTRISQKCSEKPWSHNATCPKTCDHCLPKRFLLCPLRVSHVKCKDVYSDFFPTYVDPAMGKWYIDKDPYRPLSNGQNRAIFTLPRYKFTFGYAGNTHFSAISEKKWLRVLGSTQEEEKEEWDTWHYKYYASTLLHCHISYWTES